MIYFILALLVLFLLLFLVLVSIKYLKLFYNSRGVFKLQNEWIFNLLNYKKVADFIKMNGYRTVGIIGCNKLTFLLWRELDLDNISVLFCTDKKMHSLSPIPGLKTILEKNISNYIDKIDVLIDVRIESNRDFYKKYHSNTNFSKPVINIANIVFYVSEL